MTILAPGAAAPDIAGPNINPAAPAGAFSLAGISGKVIVAVFFAYWCGYCALELERLQSLWGKYQGHNVQFVAVHTESNQAAGVAKLTEKGVTFPAVQDNAANTIFDSYDPGMSDGWPQLYVIDRDHFVHSSVAGAEPVATLENRILDAIYHRDPVDISMVMDVSDSMNGPTSAGDSKLLVMKQASKMVVDYIHDHGQTSDQMGLVWFTDDVSIYPAGGALLPVMAHSVDLKNQIDAKGTGTCTAMGAGLQTAFDLLAPGTRPRFAIVLTDGMQNIDPMVRPVGGHFEIIDAAGEYHCSLTHSSVPPHPGTSITSYNTQVHTIGVGITASYSSLLHDIAGATSGTYLATIDPATDLGLIYFVDLCNCMAGGSPAVVYHNAGTFRPDQCQTIERFLINQTIRKFTAILSWPESCAGNLVFWLRAPDGTVIDLHDRIRFYGTYAMATVSLPAEQGGKVIPGSGEWQMIIRGETGSAAPYNAMVIGEDSGTHFHIDLPHRLYEVGDILPLRVQLKEARSYLTTPSEIVLQKATLRVPLSEMLAQYQFQPAMVKTTTGTMARISSSVQLESKIRALETDVRFTGQLKQKVITQSLREGTLECAIEQNAILFPVRLTEPGLHTFRVNIRFDSPKNGPISRVSLVSVYVSPGAADPERSTVTMIPVGSGKTRSFTMLITPRNAAGQLIGPGRKADIGLLIGKEKPTYDIEDLLDGTYRVTIEPGKTGFEKSQPVTLLHKEKAFMKVKTDTPK